MTYDYSGYGKLVGKTIESVVMGPQGRGPERWQGERQDILFTFADGSKVKGVVSGDCCSSSWIEHLTIPPDIKGATIIKAGDSAPVGLSSWEDEYDHIQVYNTSIATDRGEIIIEYRNSSNGYYGGSIDFYDE